MYSRATDALDSLRPADTANERPNTESGVIRLARAMVPSLFWLGTSLYAVIFSLISLQIYHAYLPHALDLGNMAQTAWNTVHGQPFRFQNQRLHINFEAFSTTTRLSVHVEPIFPFLSAIYALWQHVETLLVLQTIVIASGAIPARLLARRRLGRGLPELVFPLAYLLYPALEAANLDEFHPVALAAPLLLWAFYFADARRYTLFLIAALAAMGCKEEIGILVGLVGLWIAWRNGDRRFGIVVAVLAVAWSLVALKVVIPHFNQGESSYYARYLPVGYPVARYPVTQGDVLQFWRQHPDLVWNDLTSEAKLSYLHRLLFPTGYLPLLSPLTLLVGLPNALLVLLSHEPHMYGGLAHYSVELVPVVIVSAIFGVEWIVSVLASRLRISTTAVVTVCCLYLLSVSLANHRANGFSPLAAHPTYPTITAHDRLLDSVIAGIPANASVSAQDTLNAHMSDRGSIFLFPDLDHNHVQNILLDASQGTGSPIHPCDLYIQVVGNAFPVAGDRLPCDVAVGSGYAPTGTPPTRAALSRARATSLLHNGRWDVAFARDGILLLHQHQPGNTRLRRVPGHTALPPQFYSFITPAPSIPDHPLRARFGDFLELDGYAIERREATNLRNADVVVTTWWRMLKAPPKTVTLMHYLSDNTGALQTFSSDQAGTDWLPINRWHPGQTYRVSSSQLTVKTDHSGHIGVDIGLTTNPVLYQDYSYDVPVQILSGPASTHLVGACACRIVQLDQIDAQL